MRQKANGAAGVAAPFLDPCIGRARMQDQHTPELPAQQGQLALALHSETAAIVVTESRDHGRLTVTTWTCAPGQRWRPNAASSIPAVMLDAAITALMMARDARAGGG